MQTRRGIMAGLWAIGLVAIMAIAIFVISRPSLPPPAEANRQQLLRWLVTRDLSLETDATRLAIVRRLEQESVQGFSWESVSGEIEPPYRKMLWKNVPYLVEPWLEDKTDGYFRQKKEEQTAYLDSVIDLIQVWRGLDSLAPRQTAVEPQGSGGFLSILLAEISATIDRADPDQRPRFVEFAMALEVRWLTRSLRSK